MGHLALLGNYWESLLNAIQEKCLYPLKQGRALPRGSQGQVGYMAPLRRLLETGSEAAARPLVCVRVARVCDEPLCGCVFVGFPGSAGRWFLFVNWRRSPMPS